MNRLCLLVDPMKMAVTRKGGTVPQVASDDGGKKLKPEAQGWTETGVGRGE